MKRNITCFALICVNTLFCLAQTPGKFTTPDASDQADSDKAKLKYIQEQRYLSRNAVDAFTGYPNDSLKGFDENSMRASLLNNGVYGSEYINFIALQKRAYIKHKYNLNPKPAPVVATPPANPTPNGKPIGGGAFVNVAPCVNEDFEASAAGQYTNATGITGWTVESGMNGTQIYSPNTTYGAACNANAIPNWNQGSPELWIVQTPLFNVTGIGTLPNSPLGGTKVIKMQDASPTGLMTRIKSTFQVTTANTLFQFAYAGSWDGVHECCGQPAFRIDMYQQSCTSSSSTLMACSNVSLTPSGSQCSSGVPGYSMTGTVSWTNWVVKYIDLTPYIGMCVTIVITNADCSYTGHHGSAYFDAMCGGQLIGTGLTGIGGNIPGPVSFCAGSNQAIITAPLGYATYSWVAPITAPAIPASQATLSTLTVSNPIPGYVYTVYLTGQSGCQFISTNTIAFSQVNIAGIGAGTTCIGGASGSATVQGNGSGTGYNYTWINAANSATVGTTQIVNGLAPGVYSVILTGLGAQGCGSAVATTTVNTGPPGIIPLLKPFCGSQAYLSMPGGSNYQWYNNLTPISANQGGTASSYTVNNPVSQSVYWLSYMSPYGCKDSVKFTLVASPPGAMGVKNISWICSGGSNGTAVVSLTPAVGAPTGVNSYSVWNTGSTTPPYNSSVALTAANNYSLFNLAAGTYSVMAFDGSCKYGTTFNVVPFTFNYATTPVGQPTLCQGNSVASNITVTTQVAPSTFNYQWTPTLHLAGSTYSNNIITPNIPIGTQTTIVYTVVVTPAVVNCPMTKFITIHAVNPAIPVISAIPDQCDSYAPYQIQVTPAGGVFNTGITGTNNPIGSGGLLFPNLAPQGLNTFTYTHNIGLCFATSTAAYHVSKFNTAALTATVPALCVTNNQFNLMNIVQNTTGSWTVVNGGPAAGVQFGTVLSPAGFNVPGAPMVSTYTLRYKTKSSPANLNTCPDSSSVPVTITKTITPAILPVMEFCTSWPAFNMTVTPAGGGWYGNSAVSAAGVITPTLLQGNQIPNSQAFYSVNIGPCLNTASITLNASRFNAATLTGTIVPQCSKNAPINLMTIAQNNTGSWTAANGSPQELGSSIQGNTLSLNQLPTGTYTLNYHVPSFPTTTLCPDNSTIAVHVLNPAVPKIANAGPLCSNGAALQLTVTPASGKWTPTSYLDANGVFTPSLASVGNNQVQYAIGTNTCNNIATKTVAVEAFVSAKIMNALPDQCNTGAPVNLQPLTLNPGTWSGPGINGITFNPSNAGSGSFTLVHKTASFPSGLCPDQDEMAVNVYSLATPVITPAGPFCNSSLPVQLQVSPVGGLFGGASMGVVELGGKFNPGSAMIGENIVNYSITSGPCVAYAQTTINVEQFVSADLARYIDPICLVAGKVNPINLDHYVKNAGGTWKGVGVTGNMFDPFKANIGNNNVLEYYTTSKTATLCADSSAVRVEIRNAPVVAALSNTLESCAPGEFFFNTPSVDKGSSGVGTWYFDDGSEPVNGLTATHVYTTPGKYTVTFAYTDDIGCEAEPAKIKDITVYEIPRADFNIPDEIFISSPEIQLSNLTTVLSNNTYEWKVSGMLLPYTDIHPVITFPKIGKYQITLVATTAGKGCKDEITKTVEVKNDFNVFIPTSFSPNFDGLNDIFIPVFTEYGLDLKSFEMEIFDRWGHVLYRTKDTTKGWDGSIQNKGEPLKEEVYIYRIKYKDLDGNAYNKMGHVTLLK